MKNILPLLLLLYMLMCGSVFIIYIAERFKCTVNFS